MSCEIPGIQSCVSVITQVGDPACSENVFSNYMRQDVKQKELILVHNGSGEDFDRWLILSRLYPLVRLYRQSPGVSAGECLNYCIERSIFEYIAIFDEQHTYDADYLSGTILEFSRNPSCLAGKKSGWENCHTDEVPLPTFLFPRTLFDAIRFQHGNSGLGTQFCRDCRSRGGKIYSTGSGGYSFPTEVIP